MSETYVELNIFLFHARLRQAKQQKDKAYDPDTLATAAISKLVALPHHFLPCTGRGSALLPIRARLSTMRTMYPRADTSGGYSNIFGFGAANTKIQTSRVTALFRSIRFVDLDGREILYVAWH